MPADVAAPKRQSLLESIKGVSKSEKRRAEAITQAKLLLEQAASAEPAEAVLLLTEAVSLRPGDAVYFEARARALHANGDPRRALYDWSMAVQLEPACLSHRMRRAAVYQVVDDPVRAIDDFTEAIRLAVGADAAPSTLGGIHAARGAAHAEAGRLEDAAVDLGAAASLLAAEDSARAHEQHGDCLRRLGRPADAAAAFRRALSGASDKWSRAPAVRRALTAVLREAGQAELAVAEATAALACHGDDASLQIALGEALAFTGRGFDALRPLAAAAASLEEDASAHNIEGGGQLSPKWDAVDGEAGGARPRLDQAFSALGSCLLRVGAPRLGALCYDRASDATRGAYELALLQSRAAQAKVDAVGALSHDCDSASPGKQRRSRVHRSPPRSASPPRAGGGRWAPSPSPADRAGRSPSRGGRPNSRRVSPARPSSPGRRPRSPSPSSRAPAPLANLAAEQATAALEAARTRKALRAAGTAFATAELGAGRCLAAVGLLEDACTRLEAAAAAATAACVIDPPLETECRLDLARLLMRLGRLVAASSQLDVCVRQRPTWRLARRKRALLRLQQHEPALCLADIAAVDRGTVAALKTLEPEETRLRVEALVALGRHAEAQETMRCLPGTAELEAGNTGVGPVSAVSPRGHVTGEDEAGVEDEAGGDALASPRLSLCRARALRARGMQQDAMPWLDAATVALADQLDLAHAALQHEEREQERHAARYAAFASEASAAEHGFGVSGAGQGLKPRMDLRELDKAAREEAARMADRPPVVLLLEREVDVRRLLIAAHDERGRCLHELHQPALAIDAYTSALELTCPAARKSPAEPSKDLKKLSADVDPLSPGPLDPGAGGLAGDGPSDPLVPRGPLLFLRACALYALCEWYEAEEEARACLASEWAVDIELQSLSVERRAEVEEQAVRSRAAAQQLLGLALARRGELWPSVTALSASLELLPSSADALLQRASVLLLSGRPAAAEEDCTHALELRPGWLLAHQRRGYAYAAMRWFEDAASEFELAAAGRPDLAVNYHAVGALMPLSLDGLDAGWTAGGGLLSFWDYGVAHARRADDGARQRGSDETDCEDERVGGAGGSLAGTYLLGGQIISTAPVFTDY